MQKNTRNELTCLVMETIFLVMARYLGVSISLIVNRSYFHILINDMIYLYMQFFLLMNYNQNKLNIALSVHLGSSYNRFLLVISEIDDLVRHLDISGLDSHYVELSKIWRLV